MYADLQGVILVPGDFFYNPRSNDHRRTAEVIIGAPNGRASV